MPPTPSVVIEIDDNSSLDDRPFTCDPSVWSLWGDFNLATRTGADVFREMHAAVDRSRFRGYPPNVSRTTFALFDGLVDAEEVTWLTAAELPSSPPWLPDEDTDNGVEKSLLCVFGTVELMARKFGGDRVRLVFCFS